MRGPAVGRRGLPGRQGAAGRGRAGVEDHLRPQRTQRGPASHHRVPRGHRSRPGQARKGQCVGENRPAECRGQRQNPPGVPLRRPPAGDHDATPAPPHLGEESLHHPLRGVLPNRGVVPGTPGRPARREVPGRAAKWLPEGQVGVHRTRSPGTVPRLGDEPAPEGSPVAPAGLVGHPGIDEEAGGASVEVLLVDGLGSADVAQLGGTVGGADDERHTGEVRLHDRRVELGGGRAARHHHDDRASRSERPPDGEEARRPLVQPDLRPDAVIGGQRQRHRARAGPGGDHRLGHPGAHPLVDEGRREARR